MLRERTSALEMSNLDWAKAFFNDASPAKLVFFMPNGVSSAGAAETSVVLKPFVNLLQLNAPGL